MEERQIEGLMLTAMDSIRDMINVNTIIPSWSSFPSWANYVASIKFALFPRIGFSLRF